MISTPPPTAEFLDKKRDNSADNAPKRGWATALQRVCGGLSILLGSVVLYGWYAHNLALLRVLPAFVAMAYNTALCFLLCGLGMLSLRVRCSPGSRFISLFCAGGSLAFGLLTLSEYAFGASLGIDQLLMHAYVRSGVTAPGRMAFCTALCFSVTGAALLLAHRPRFALRPFLLALTGSAVVGLGTVALSGYFTGIVQSYAWGQFTRMAVHTASGFLVLGLGLLAFAWHDDSQASGGRGVPRWLPVPVGIGATTITLCLWQALIVEQSAQRDFLRQLAASNPTLHLTRLVRAQSLLPLETLLGGLLLAALLTWAVSLAQIARRQAEALRAAQDELEVRVAERTAALAEANQALAGVSEWQRGFLRDVLASVTEGKLRLCHDVDDLPGRLGETTLEPIFLSRQLGLADLRGRALEAAEVCGFRDGREHDLVTAVNEAGMNAIVHAGDGTAHVCFSFLGTVQVWVEDTGQGITLENLPRATLSRGFTTAGTLGHGLKLMLQTADRLWLLTGPTGTTVVVEQDRDTPEPFWLQTADLAA